MTRTETRSYGVVTPSTRQPLLEAMLRAFAWLVSNVASLFGMIINRNTRDWHTDAAHEDQLSLASDITQKEAQPHQSSFSGKAEGRIPGIPVVSTQGTATYSLCATNQDARHKAEHDSVGVVSSGSVSSGHAFPAQAGIQSARNARYSRAHLSPVIPGEGAQRRRPGPLERHAPRLHTHPWLPAHALRARPE